MTISRRNFIKTSGIATTGIALGGLALSARSYGNVLGANDQLNIAVMGTNSRGHWLSDGFAQSDNTHISHICDVDKRVIEKTSAMIMKKYGYQPQGEKDYRKVLKDKDVDIVVIVAPDHWHAPASIMALQAGKHVYVEKPCSHNPKEGELLVQAQKKYGKVVQMGNQQRSAMETLEAMQLINEGAIGEVYYGKAWYSNSRGSIGTGQLASVPEWLDWELWQGPAPRREYKDNIVHYNWHWFQNWGTGEILNNGTHEVDICRWALGVDYPVKVTSNGGRFHFQDDWEFYDTQNANFEFEAGKMINWEGRSCNSFNINQKGRGASIHGTKGTFVLDRSGYQMYDNSNKLIKEALSSNRSNTADLVGGGNMDLVHFDNFLKAIRLGEKQNSPIDEGHKSVLLCQLGNVAQKTGKTLHCDPSNGHIINDGEAMKMWGREYEPGWELKV